MILELAPSPPAKISDNLCNRQLVPSNKSHNTASRLGRGEPCKFSFHGGGVLPALQEVQETEANGAPRGRRGLVLHPDACRRLLLLVPGLPQGFL